MLPQIGGDGFLFGTHPVGIFRTRSGAESSDLRFHLQDQYLQLLLALLAGLGIDISGVFLAVRPHWRVAALPEMFPQLADAPGSRPAPGRLHRHKVLLCGFVCLFQHGLHFRLGDTLVDVQRRFPPHLIGDVGIGIQGCGRGDISDKGGERLYIFSSVFK